jgi:hypothetical protein
MSLKLLSIKRSTNPYKKLMATFLIDGKTKRIVHFGDSSYPDYTRTGDELQKELYLKRHQSRENWDDPLTAGSLSKHILWSKPTLKEAIQDFKNKFNL